MDFYRFCCWHDIVTALDNIMFGASIGGVSWNNHLIIDKLKGGNKDEK